MAYMVKGDITKVEFYNYLWLREDGTPYYVGKGKGNRAFSNKYHIQKCPPLNRIVLFPAESEQEAFETEKALIWYYGRKDLGTGCLRNLTDGGDGASGYKTTPEVRARMKAGHARNPQIGKKHHMFGRKHTPETKAKIVETLKGNTRRLGVPHTPETKAKISAAGKGRKFTEEHKAKISAAHKARITEKK